MKALVYHGPGARRWETVRDPKLVDSTDVIVRIDASTICGTDLHILKGDVPEVKPGTVLGHEAVGTIVELGPAVTTLAEGDRVLVSCITACGRCRFCREGHYGLCMGGGGWIFGHLIDGLQAEYARIPFADTSVYKIPAGLTDEQVLFLADILPTAYEVGVLNGSAARPPSGRRDEQSPRRRRRATSRSRVARLDRQEQGASGTMSGASRAHTAAVARREIGGRRRVTSTSVVNDAVDVILRDGSTLRLRAPVALDLPALVRFFQDLSGPQLLSPLPRVTG